MYFKETKFPYKQVTIPNYIPHSSKYLFPHYQLTVKEKIMPAIKEMEEKNLIEDFYIMNHAGIDLRIAADWEKYKWHIESILILHHLPADLKDYEYKDDDLNELTPIMNAFLRFNTKLLFDYLTIKDEGFQEEYRDWIPIIPAQYMHFLFNQWGYRNIEEALVYDYFAYQQIIIAYNYRQIDHKYMRNLFKNMMKNNAKRYWAGLKYDTKKVVKKWLKRKGKY